MAGRILQKEDIESVRKDKAQIQQLLRKNYQQEVYHNNDIPLRGVTTIYLNLLEESVQHILQYDAQRAPFRYLEGEKCVKAEWELPANDRHEAVKLRFKGYMDRIDEKDNTIQIIDYKTGKGEKECNGEQLFTLYKYKNPSQTAFYRWLYHQAFPQSDRQTVETHLYYIPELVKPDCNTSADIKNINNRDELYQAMEERITALIESLLDPQIALMPAEKDDNCTYCPFVGICNKHVNKDGSRP